MANTKKALDEFAANVDESMGVRQIEVHPQFSPKASARDMGRVPLREFGRVDIDRVMADPDQPRVAFDEHEIQHLAESIRQKGQLHPIRARWDGQLQHWIVVTGERRFRAAKSAGLKQIDCFFIDKEITPSEILEQQLVENLLRENLKPLEEARGYATLMELNGWNGKRVATALRVSQSKVSRAIALLDLPAEVQADIESGKIPPSSAYELSKLGNAQVQAELAEQAATGAMNQKQTATAVRQRRGKKTKKGTGIRLSFPAENGIGVTVTANRNRTYLEIEQALIQAIEEVRLRIDNNVQLF